MRGGKVAEILRNEGRGSMGNKRRIRSGCECKWGVVGERLENRVSRGGVVSAGALEEGVS